MNDKRGLHRVLGIIRITERLDFGEYDERLDGDYITVWVNIDTETVARWNSYKDEEATLRAMLAEAEGGEASEERAREIAAQTRAMEEKVLGFYRDLWDMPEEDVKAFYTVNRPLFSWAIKRSWELINEYRQKRPKARGGG